MFEIYAEDAELYRQSRTLFEIDLARDLYVLLNESPVRALAAECLTRVIKRYMIEAPDKPVEKPAEQPTTRQV